MMFSRRLILLVYLLLVSLTLFYGCGDKASEEGTLRFRLSPSKIAQIPSGTEYIIIYVGDDEYEISNEGGWEEYYEYSIEPGIFGEVDIYIEYLDIAGNILCDGVAEDEDISRFGETYVEIKPVCSQAYISLNPNSGIIGSEVAVIGGNFAGDEVVSIDLGDERGIAMVGTDATGSFEAFFDVPDDAPIGNISVLASGDSSGRHANALFNRESVQNCVNFSSLSAGREDSTEIRREEVVFFVENGVNIEITEGEKVLVVSESTTVRINIPNSVGLNVSLMGNSGSSVVFEVFDCDGRRIDRQTAEFGEDSDIETVSFSGEDICSAVISAPPTTDTYIAEVCYWY